MENNNADVIAQKIIFGWIAPDGKIYPCVRKEQQRIASALCRDILNMDDPPFPMEVLLDAGWVEVRHKEHIVFRKWPTDPQFDTMSRYGLTTATQQNRCMFDVLNYKEVRDYFFLADNFKGKPWYNDFRLFQSIGVCSVPHEQVFEVRDALARFGYDTYTADKPDQHGYTFIIGGSKDNQQPKATEYSAGLSNKETLLEQIRQAVPEEKSYIFSLVTLTCGDDTIEDMVVGRMAADYDTMDEAAEEAVELLEDNPDVGTVSVESYTYLIGSGESDDMPSELVELVKQYGAADFINLNDVSQIGRFDFGIERDNVL